MYGVRTLAGLALAAAVAVGMGGCAAAAGAAAGAGAAEYVQAASPESAVNASIDQAAGWTLAAFRELGIAVTQNELKDNGQNREIEGTSGSGESIHVTLEPQANGTTTIQVTAKKNTVQYDKGYAQKILAQILSKR